MSEKFLEVLGRIQQNPALQTAVIDLIQRLEYQNTVIPEQLAELANSPAPTFLGDELATMPFGFEDIDLEASIETWVPEDENTDQLEERPKKQKKIYPKIGRYDDLGVLGFGGMGEVRKVRDPELNRGLAMKIIHPQLLVNSTAIARFIEEGQVCAQLQHPNIVPIHEIGRLDDGRLYFTMKEIKGRAFSKAIEEVHGAIENDRWQITDSGWSFRKLVDVFHQVCQAISYAHSKGVLHRDLKPENIMLGEYGEVLVVDWGIAKVLGRQDLVAKLQADDLVTTDRSEQNSFATRVGQIAGTPAYMSPEQAKGQINQLDARSDIYSLGAILYEILTGKRPYFGESGRQVLQRVLQGPPQSIRTINRDEAPRLRSLEFLNELGSLERLQYSGTPLPDELVEACEKAMSRVKSVRYSSVSEFTKVLEDWLDGAKKKERALKVVQEAMELNLTKEKMKEQAQKQREEAEKKLREIPDWESEAIKGPWWEKEAEAQKLEQEVELLHIVQEQKLQAALTHKADLEEAHIELAKRYYQHHREQEKHRKIEKAQKTEIRLQEHVTALPNSNIEKSGFLTYLKGVGALSLFCDTDDVEIILEQFVPHHKRLIAKPIANLGVGALKEYPLMKGSYRIRLRKNGYHEVLYPISIGRGEFWHCFDPSGDLRPIHIPRLGELGRDECFVPGGWFWAGGSEGAQYLLPRKRIWVDSFVIQKYPVTNRQYIAFLNDLIKQGREEEAQQYVPRERAGHAGELGASIYGRTADGGFMLVPDADGDLWELDWPVLMVDWFCGVAYSKWESKRKDRKYRLLHELEWEKAARGVDGRAHPWGDGMDPSFACMRRSHQERPLVQKNSSFPIDESVYGVRGLAGNSRDWSLSDWKESWDMMEEIEWKEENHGVCQVSAQVQRLEKDWKKTEKTARRLVKGGFWGGGGLLLRSYIRDAGQVGLRSGDLGFRIGYPLK